jgi:Flp pilus assembly protein CpaB
MVTGDDAAKIQLAAKSGTLSLALRGDEDTVESPQNSTIIIDSVLGIGPKSPTQEVQSEGKVIVGGKEYLIVGGKLLSPEEVAALNRNQP